ncbi:MAG: hypothetical protein U1F43_17715 [Myxococcota bacterium]
MAEVESALAARGVPSLDAAAWDARRIAAAWPTDAVDLGPDDLALFSERLLATVSWTKGCFLGQEVFVMARDRGEVPKRLRGIEVAPGESLGRGEKILSEDGKVVGSVGSSAGSLGLALVKRKHADGGSPLHLEDGRRATVVVLPRTVSGEA